MTICAQFCEKAHMYDIEMRKRKKNKIKI